MLSLPGDPQQQEAITTQGLKGKGEEVVFLEPK